MDEKIKLLTSQLGDDRVKQEVDILKAKAIYTATSSRELIKSVSLCQELKIDFVVRGLEGQNEINKDGFKGVVINNRSNSIKIFGIKGKVSSSGLGIEEALIEADSGASLTKLIDFVKQQKLICWEDLPQRVSTIGESLIGLKELKNRVYQVKVLSDKGGVEMKNVDQITQGDIIITVIFKLQSQSRF